MSEKKAEAAPKAAPAKSNRLVVMGAAAFLVVGGGGGGFWYWSRAARAEAKAGASHKDAKHSKHGKADEEEDPTEEAEDEAPEGPEAEGGVISLEPFLVNLADKGGSRFLRATLKLVVADEKKAEKLSKNPAVIGRLRSAILELLTVQTADTLVTAEGKAALRKEIRKRASPLTGGVKVTDVLFADFVVQF
jgi:flagellar FliL protein